ncbi:lamin tail domain-containing protein [bacterium]|nr:lamin tail domain-containing protein [bacterium]MBU1064870.1 lamin tail domain-containing protein [bacterium]MBU1634304.1 lamin tail domain-containing protein [bacterium]MBU1874594.1 lamin tail domain-containing protein [bacterium]
MKRFLPIIVTSILVGQFLFAGDLFFSEYIEGSSNNKALEIYNPTGAAVDLSHYTVKQANGGSGWGSVTIDNVLYSPDKRYILPLSGALNAGDVYVIYHLSAASSITSVGDTGFVYSSDTTKYGSNVPSFNGDDALGLFKDGVLIDVIGVPTTDPGTGWAVAGTSLGTLDHTIVRKSTIQQGNTDWTASAGTSADDSEWIVYAKDTFTYLGSHVCEGGANVVPVASAGIDRVERFDATVTLDGSASNDPDGSIVSYAWAQVSGTSVTLSATNLATVTFTSPSSVAELKFELTVTDDSSAVVKDYVTIYVNPSPIIISEYVEGSSNNKYLELYNAADASINLTDEGYSIKKATNGSGAFDTDNEFTDWGDNNILQSGQTIVLAHVSHVIYTNPDIVVEGTYSVMSFNGNDAVGLFRDGWLVDVIGDPNNTADIIKDMTLRRKNTSLFGNSTYSVGEWEEFGQDNIENLGIHSTNPYAPAISNVTLASDFITSAMEIELSAEIVAAEGKEISVALIKYGTGGSFPNEREMWLDNSNTWMGVIPAQAAYTELDYKIVATDNESNSGESTASSILIADATMTNIADIRANRNTYIGNMVTVQGIVTIGTNVIDSRMTKAYLQDASGKGINLFDYSLISGIDRGDELHMVGTVTEYNSVLELTEFSFETVSTGNNLPEVQTISIAEANSLEYEGTLVKFNGVIKDTSVAGGGVSVYVKQGDDSTTVRIWESTGIDFASINIGSSYWFQGVVNPYYSDFQLLVAYQEDIWGATAVDDQIAVAMKFDLQPAYPNPFNPSTTISWNLDRAGDYELAAYNMLGQKVDVISKSFGPAGAYTINWNARQLPSGVYFIQLDAQDRHITQKVLLIK